MLIEKKLEELGLVLPEQLQAPAGIKLPFAFVRIHGNRAYISGHGPQAPDGSLAKPLGKVGAEVSLDEGYQAARIVALSILSSLKRTLGDLDRVDVLHAVIVEGFDLELPVSPRRTTATRCAANSAFPPSRWLCRRSVRCTRAKAMSCSSRQR